MTLKSLIPLIAFLAVAALLGVGLVLNPKEIPSALINKQAPEFTLSILNTPGNKQSTATHFSPSELKGQRIGLNYKDEPKDALKWLAKRGNPYSKVASDYKGDVGIDWGVYGVPETFVIDEKGNIIYRFSGPINENILNKEILPLFDSSTH